VGARDREDRRTLLIDETETDRDEERNRKKERTERWDGVDLGTAEKNYLI
jgi:hypothetical protein